jgi:selenocysteine lyase/cysteine desulfurase
MARFSRRDFARLLATGGSAMLLPQVGLGAAQRPPLPPTPASPGEDFWHKVRAQFVMPEELAMMNAANLCPSSGVVLESLYKNTRDIDQDPSPANRAKMGEGKERARKAIAEFLRVTPEEIIITRNTSESNNLVSSGLDLKPGDEVLLCADNHPSNMTAWREKAKRFGYTVRTIEQPNPHPGADYYVDAFNKAVTPQTRVFAFTHLTSTVGDLLPAADLCRAARERGVLTLVDGAQSFGLFDVNLSEMQPDFYSGSAHKWPCGPKEAGVLYVNSRSQARIAASIYSAYPGAVGLSKTFESFGQRDEPAIIAFAEALALQTQIGRAAIERRSRALAQQLMAGLRTIDGMKLWTSPDPARSAAVVSFQPATLDVRKLNTALYEKDRIVCMTRGGNDRPGLRFSPHFYNSPAEVDRVIAALKRYTATGV